MILFHLSASRLAIVTGGLFDMALKNLGFKKNPKKL